MLTGVVEDGVDAADEMHRDESGEAAVQRDADHQDSVQAHSIGQNNLREKFETVSF